MLLHFYPFFSSHFYCCIYKNCTHIHPALPQKLCSSVDQIVLISRVNSPEKAALSHIVRLSMCVKFISAHYPPAGVQGCFFYLHRSAAHFRHFTNTDVSFHRALNQLEPAPTNLKILSNHYSAGISLYIM